MITVVVPVRNRADLIIRSLNSIAAQHMPALHLLVVDNGSTDNTAQVVSRWIERNGKLFERAVLLHESVPGAAAARNRGLAEVTTPLVTFFDSDDEMMPDHLRRFIQLFDTVPGLELAFGDRMIRDSDGWTETLAVNDDDLLRGHLLHCALQTDVVVATTDLMRRTGGFDVGLPRWNDYELGVRLLIESRLTRKLTGSPSVLIHPQPHSITGLDYSHSADDLERALDTIDSYLAKHEYTYERRYVDARRMTLAAHYAREKSKYRALRLIENVKAQPKTLYERCVLSLIYQTVRLAGKGGAFIAQTLLSPPPSRRQQNMSAVEKGTEC